ncbi:unnamed protein product, partial [Dicrocoelium dendriticum]
MLCAHSDWGVDSPPLHLHELSLDCARTIVALLSFLLPILWRIAVPRRSQRYFSPRLSGDNVPWNAGQADVDIDLRFWLKLTVKKSIRIITLVDRNNVLGQTNTFI